MAISLGIYPIFRQTHMQGMFNSRGCSLHWKESWPMACMVSMEFLPYNSQEAGEMKLTVLMLQNGFPKGFPAYRSPHQKNDQWLLDPRNRSSLASSRWTCLFLTPNSFIPDPSGGIFISMGKQGSGSWAKTLETWGILERTAPWS